MRKVDPKIETLITRRLDGELAEQDELTLDRELIRDPTARDMLESYERVDRLAADALSEALGTQQTQVELPAATSHAAPSRGVSTRWIWQLATGAIAAAILAVFVARFTPGPSPSNENMVQNNQPQPIPQMIPSLPNRSGPENIMRNVGSSRPKTWRDTGREMFGVVGDDGNIYWIGIDRTRTAKLNRSERM